MRIMLMLLTGLIFAPLATGTLRLDEQIIHVLEGRIRNLSDEGLDLPTTSRDFR